MSLHSLCAAPKISVITADKDCNKNVHYDNALRVLVIKDGDVIQSLHCNVLWCGRFSTAGREGSIVKHIMELSREYKVRTEKSNMFVIPMEDGELTSSMDMWEARVMAFHHQCLRDGLSFFLCTLAQRTLEIYPHFTYVFLPLDDTFFSQGTVRHFLPHHVPWEQRKNDLCWRGMCSGEGGARSVRVRFVEEICRLSDSLRDNLNISSDNVKLCRMHSENKGFPSHFFANQGRDTIDYREFMEHKIFFIVDGNVIASNHMWGFASGCVPVMISNAQCWFSKFLVPHFHYVPVKYDLSDLYEKISWIATHDQEASQIARNAVYFAELVFSSDFQKQYLHNSIFDGV